MVFFASMQLSFREVSRPTLLVDVDKARQNIFHMARKAQRNGIRFRPHFKTPQSAMASLWYRDAGVEHITVSSLDMAAYFLEAGWTDILVAFPVNLRTANQINALASRCKLGLILESVETARHLEAQLLHPCDLWLEVDCGHGRTGLPIENEQSILQVSRELSMFRNLNFKGLITHAGHSYQARGLSEIQALHTTVKTRLIALKQRLKASGLDGLQLSYGDTPTCSGCEDFDGIDEIRPGNFVFYDWMQVEIGSCKPADVAAVVACPVVTTYPEQGKAVIHGGAVHLSKDMLKDTEGRPFFGMVGLPAEGGWTAPLPGCKVVSLSQEHGVVQLSKEVMQVLRPGDLLMVYPVHSCLTADLMGSWLGTDGLKYTMMPRP